MKPINFDTLSAKELKVIATEKGLKFEKNASSGDMRELLRNTPEEVVETPEVTQDEIVEETPEITPEVTEEESPEEVVETRLAGTYTVKQNIKKDGNRYVIGDTIRLEDEEAKNLLSEGIIE